LWWGEEEEADAMKQEILALKDRDTGIESL
jgi:hypothetical protein